MTEIYCSAPWRGLTVLPDGKVKTCCLGKHTLGDLNDNIMQDILNGAVLKEIQREMAGGGSSNCVACYQDEAQGNHASLRQYYLKYYPRTLQPKQQLEVLDLRWNNKCNLFCQYCGAHSSSVWEEKLKIKPAKARKPYEDDLLDWILPQIHGLREILLQGGEPMLMKQNHKLFELAPPTCQFSIITNLSYDIKNLPCMHDLLSRPKDKIIWNISAENTGDKFEYIRQGANWQQFTDNLSWLISHWPDTVSMNMIYCIFSAEDILETIKTFHAIGVKKFTLLTMHDNPHLMLHVMPDAVQAKCLDVLYQVKQWHTSTFGQDADLYPISGLDNLIEGLTQPRSHVIVDKKTFFDKIAWHDAWNDRKFSDLWADLARYLSHNLS